jgi:NitT/TauT family transport system ATP-binding protein
MARSRCNVTIQVPPAEISRSRAAGVQIVDLTKVYDTRTGPLTVFDHLSLDVVPGAFVAVVGPSGCGKTTLLLCLAGLLKPTTGEVRVDGDAISGPAPEQLGVIFQEANLLPWRSVLDNVAFPLELRGVSKKERYDRAAGFLELVHLSDFAQAYPSELSGGMKQRVAIARGLIQDPRVLLMDEPFASIDEQTRRVFQDDLLRLWSEERKTVVLVTHSMEEAIYLSDRVVVLSPRPGRVHQTLDVPLPRPRETGDVRATAEFARLVDGLWKVLRKLQ